MREMGGVIVSDASGRFEATTVSTIGAIHTLSHTRMLARTVRHLFMTPTMVNVAAPTLDRQYLAGHKGRAIRDVGPVATAGRAADVRPAVGGARTSSPAAVRDARANDRAEQQE